MIEFLTGNPLENQNLRQELIKCYQEVFGGKPWKEGLYCSKEGWKKLYPLQEFWNGRNFCDCGAPLRICHPAHKIKERLKQELAGDSVFGYAREDEKILGFIWAKVMTVKKLAFKISNLKQTDLDYLMQGLKDKLLSLDIVKVSYAYEIGVIQSARKGPLLATQLTKLWLEKSQGITALYWTSEKSNIYKLSLLIGFRPILYISNLVFLINNVNTEIIKSIQPDSNPFRIALRLAHATR